MAKPYKLRHTSCKTFYFSAASVFRLSQRNENEHSIMLVNMDFGKALN